MSTSPFNFLSLAHGNLQGTIQALIAIIEEDIEDEEEAIEEGGDSEEFEHLAPLLKAVVEFGEAENRAWTAMMKMIAKVLVQEGVN